MGAASRGTLILTQVAYLFHTYIFVIYSLNYKIVYFLIPAGYNGDDGFNLLLVGLAAPLVISAAIIFYLTVIKFTRGGVTLYQSLSSRENSQQKLQRLLEDVSDTDSQLGDQDHFVNQHLNNGVLREKLEQV